MRLHLINPSNPLVSIVRLEESRWNRYRVWQPLSLMVLAGLTPPEWDVTLLDENVGRPYDQALPLPDLVGITAFTSQAPRAYEIAARFRSLGVPVVMGGIHATMCVDEAMPRVDSVVTGEADTIWPQVLEDAAHGCLKRRYEGGLARMDAVRPARHDLLTGDYAFGAIQTTRGCPMNCTFCSVTAFNGAQYRQRSIPEVVQEFRSIPERRVLVVDDNLIGTRAEHIARAKDLFRALAAANLGKSWIAQAMINFADDEELLTLAAKAGCAGVFVGFESPTAEGLTEVGKRFNLRRGRNLAASVARIQRHHILVVGSFIIGLDADTAGIGRRTAEAARQYGVDILNTLFLTPLPGTGLWDQMSAEGRLVFDTFPEAWKYYTLTFPVARYKHLSRDDAIYEMLACDGHFYAMSRILGRVWKNVWQRRQLFISLCGNLSYRRNLRLNRKAYGDFSRESARWHCGPPGSTGSPAEVDAPHPFRDLQQKPDKQREGWLATWPATSAGRSASVCSTAQTNIPGSGMLVSERSFPGLRRTALEAREFHMLYTIAVILLVAWLLGIVGTYTIGAFVHVLLVIAIVLFVVGLLNGRRVLG